MADDITHQQILDKIDTGNKKLLDAMTQQLGVITDDMVTKDDVKDIVREETADIRDEQLRQGGLLDDLDNKVSAIAESVGSELELKERVNRHDGRIAALESKGKIVISTVTHHSRQIKALQTNKSS
ncbi:MAG TPA: hypothetical protein VNG32_00725 [Candidatus Dormibacteraeota bacterium]|nr:hypothetical protein [Candidatus Dormibacteraeota bacterium]